MDPRADPRPDSSPGTTTDGVDVGAMAALGPDVVIQVCPGGPLLVRGPAGLVDGDGTDLRGDRRTFALCRCGRSGLAPFCDGTHKKRRRSTTVDRD